MSTASYPAPTSPLYEVACAYLRASNDQDWTALEATLADSFTHQIHPASIRTHGHEDRLAKTDFLERAKMMLGKGKMFEALNVSRNPSDDGASCSWTLMTAARSLFSGMLTTRSTSSKVTTRLSCR